MSGAQDVLVDRPRREVALVTLNRPDRLNALTAEMLAHIYEVLEGLGRDPTCRVIVITGAGRGSAPATTFVTTTRRSGYRPTSAPCIRTCTSRST